MLTNLQLLILQLTVNDFIESAQPVGSRQLSKKPEAPFSPATIRNEMADLEELGFLEKTHSSSGRIPSEKGYRYYVDHLMQPVQLKQSDRHTVRSLFEQKVTESEELIRKTATILSDLTTYTSILLGPDTSSHTIKRFAVVPLTEREAVAIIVTESGRVENKLIHLPPNFSVYELEKMVNILNDRLIGTPINQLQFKLATEVYALLKEHVQSADELYLRLNEAMVIQAEEKLFFGGKLNMMKQPEFHDLHKIEVLFNLMDKDTPSNIFFQGATTGIQISIGSENNHDAMEDCSIISADYDAGGNSTGKIAIIGPKRMDYGRVITVLDTMSKLLSSQFKK
ncbi:MAG TPA: heat-inducible transcriptional repressor HrcA [Savagea sp.]